MTPYTRQLRLDCFAWLTLLVLAAGGCARLAPGISPIAIDPPESACYGCASDSDTMDTASLGIEDDDVMAAKPEASDEAVDYSAGELIPVASGDSDQYIARQYPRVYPAPPPPPTTYTVPSTPTTVNQPPSVYQLPPTYQPPQNYQVQQGGSALPPPQALPPSGSFPPSQSLPPPIVDYGPASPSFGSPIYGDPSFGSPVDPYGGVPSAPPVYIPNTRTADLEISGFPARTGRIMFGGAVNSDAGVTGQITIDERNFDITRFPRSFQDLASGTAFRGAGQTLRLEAVPGSQFKRYTASFADPNLFGYLPISFGISGFLYDRRYQDYDEERLGARVSFGYRVTPELSLTTAIGGQNVEVSNARVNGGEIDQLTGDHDLFTGEVRLTHDTRNSPFQPSEGHYFEFGYEKTFGDFDYSRFDIENRNYLLLAQRADGSGKQTLAFSTRLGFAGDETPFFENYYAGGYATMRGFDFRGASPVTDDNEQIGGRFQWLNSLEYMFPITADDAFRGVAFMDFGTVERDIEINSDNFRVAPGVGLRISIPALGPAPLAFDFAYPISEAAGDDRRIFSFYISALR